MKKFRAGLSSPKLTDSADHRAGRGSSLGTDERRRLELAKEDRPQLSRRGGSPGGGGKPGGRTGRRGGTTLYDSVLLARDEIASKQQGRKALILLTDGVDNGSRVPLSDAIRAVSEGGHAGLLDSVRRRRGESAALR